MNALFPKCARCALPATRRASRRTSRRGFSCQPSRPAARDPHAVAEAFLNKFSKGQKFVRQQLLDANQLRLFSLALDRPYVWGGTAASPSTSLETAEPPTGTPIPAGYHLVYFTPAQLPGILGLDGTDASFNPDAPFTRRMWAGGSCQWPGADPQSANPAQAQALLRVGDLATEVTEVLSCEPKVIGKTGEPMLVVGVKKEFRNSRDELCVVDRRNWVFRTVLDPVKPAPLVPKPAEWTASQLDESARGKVLRTYTRSEATLFRFSALTFNAHRIHYDRPWATQMEGHRNVVVHGPMNLIAMLDLWRDEKVRHHGPSAPDGVIYPQKIQYRATSPVYAGEPYRVMMDAAAVDTKDAQVTVTSNDGTLCMKGTISGWS